VSVGGAGGAPLLERVHAVHYLVPMPTVHRLGHCRIAIYPMDHNPPHFHVLGVDFQVLVEIGTWRVIGSHPRGRDIGEALAWARANEARLRAVWQEQNP